MLCVCVCVWCGAHAAKSAHSRRRRLHLWISHRVDSISYSVAGRRAIALLFFFFSFFICRPPRCVAQTHANETFTLTYCVTATYILRLKSAFRVSDRLNFCKGGKSTLEKWRTQSVQHRFVDIHVKNHRRNLRDRWHIHTYKKKK